MELQRDWGTEIVVKDASDCLVRFLKINAGEKLVLAVEPETLYLQTGSLICSDEYGDKILSEGCGDVAKQMRGKVLTIQAISSVMLLHYMNLVR